MFWRVVLFIYSFICLSIIHIFIYLSIPPASHSFHRARRYLLNHVKENIAFCIYQSSGSLHMYRNLQRNEFINCPLKNLLIPYHLSMSPQSFNSSEPRLLNMDILFIEISYFYWWPKQCLQANLQVTNRSCSLSGIMNSIRCQLNQASPRCRCSTMY